MYVCFVPVKFWNILRYERRNNTRASGRKEGRTNEPLLRRTNSGDDDDDENDADADGDDDNRKKNRPRKILTENVRLKERRRLIRRSPRTRILTHSNSNTQAQANTRTKIMKLYSAFLSFWLGFVPAFAALVENEFLKNALIWKTYL